MSTVVHMVTYLFHDLKIPTDSLFSLLGMMMMIIIIIIMLSCLLVLVVVVVVVVVVDGCNRHPGGVIILTGNLCRFAMAHCTLEIIASYFQRYMIQYDSRL